MKKALLIFLLMAGVYQLKAQQFFAVKPADSLKNDLLNKLKAKPDERLKLFQPKSNLLQPLQFAALNRTSNNVDRMPIAVLSGNSKMPVVKLGGYYTMPVKKIGTVDELPLIQNALPGLPSSNKP